MNCFNEILHRILLVNLMMGDYYGVIKEEHYSVYDSKRNFLFHFTPYEATKDMSHAKIIATRIYKWLEERRFDKKNCCHKYWVERRCYGSLGKARKKTCMPYLCSAYKWNALEGIIRSQQVSRELMSKNGSKADFAKLTQLRLPGMKINIFSYPKNHYCVIIFIFFPFLNIDHAI